jgi:L-ribulokinase
MNPRFSIGVDFGTSSVRALIVDVETGDEVGVGVYPYEAGTDGVLTAASDPHLARQDPRDYVRGIEASIRGALSEASSNTSFQPEHVVGIGIDTTGSTPIPVDADGMPLALDETLRDDLASYVWLWKDHTSHREAAEITDRARNFRPQFLAKCGGTYSSEWFWSKILHCARTSPDVFEAAHTWVEHADWMPALLTGSTAPEKISRGICAAGHKAMYSRDWGGYPDEEFLSALDPRLVLVRRTLPGRTYDASQAAGKLTAEWADRLGLPEGITVAVGAFDAHLGAVGAGIGPNTLVKIIGTSTCDLMVAPEGDGVSDIPGLCGIVPGSVMPGHFGLEAGQSAVGDIFNWFVNEIGPGGRDHASLSAEAERIGAGTSGLLALDWHNGNRTILVDQRLSGLILGLTLHTSPAEIYRALIEATAFGARVIMERYEEYGVEVRRIVNCGGISAKNALVMQIYADVMGRPVIVSHSTQTCALGAAISGAVASGLYPDFPSAIAAMTRESDVIYEPRAEPRRIYDRLFRLYRQLHDGFGLAGTQSDVSRVMKELLNIRDEARRA